MLAPLAPRIFGVLPRGWDSERITFPMRRETAKHEGGVYAWVEELVLLATRGALAPGNILAARHRTE